MPKYRIPLEEIKKLKPKGSDLPKIDPKTGKPVPDPSRGFKSWHIYVEPSNYVEVETREDYDKELKDLIEKKRVIKLG